MAHASPGVIRSTFFASNKLQTVLTKNGLYLSVLNLANKLLKV